MLTLLDCQNDPGLISVSGVCPTSQDFTDLVNTSQRRLLRRGDWFETFVPIFVCVYNGCLVMPRYVQQIRRINICNRAFPVHNGWWEFLAFNQSYCGWGSQVDGWRGQQCGLTQQGTSAVFQDVMGDGRLIRAYPRCQGDVGKTMTIFGVDNNGQPLVTIDPNTGIATQGVQIVLALPFGSTNTYVRRIDYVVRDQTSMIVDVYAYNATTNLLEDIAHYEPSETTPTYARYKLNGGWQGQANVTSPGCCGVARGVLMMVKLAYIPAINPTDLVLISNVDALKKMFQSIKFENANDIQNAKLCEADAISEMNREFENNFPDEQFAAAVNTLGPGVWSNSCF